MIEEQQLQYVFQIGTPLPLSLLSTATESVSTPAQRMQTKGEVAMDPKPEVEKAWHDDIQERLKCTVWNIDCGGWVGLLSASLMWIGKLTDFLRFDSTSTEVAF